MNKKYIIKESRDFDDIIKTGKKLKNYNFLLFYKESNDQFTKYGISVPKKTGKANIRNKLKRRLKNIIDNNEFYIQIPYDYVIITRKRLLELNYKDMESSFINLLQKIGENDE